MSGESGRTIATDRRRLRLILGPAGSGKTVQALNELRQQTQLRQGWSALDAPLLVLLAPEQQALSLEHALHASMAQSGDADSRALARTRVVSFSRLAHQLSEDMGRPQAERIGHAGKRAVIWQILDPARRTAARVEMLHSLFTELALNGAGPADLQTMRSGIADASAAQWQAGLADRLDQAALDYGAYLAACTERGIEVLPPAARLPQLMAESALLDGAQLWLDGFAGFTGAEWRGLRGLLEGRIAGLTLTLLLDPQIADEPDALDRYYPTRQLLGRIEGLAARCGWQTERIGLNAPRRWTAGKPDTVLVECSDVRSEVEWAVREAVRLTSPVAEGGGGLSYGELSIVVPDMRSYSAMLAARLADYGVRSFVDMPHPLAQHPLVVYLRCSLRLAFELQVPGSAERNDAYELLGTGLLPLPQGTSREALFEVENYARLMGWDVRDWLSREPLAVPPVPPELSNLRQRNLPDQAELDQLQAVRDCAMARIHALRAALQPAGDLRATDLLVAAWRELLPDEAAAGPEPHAESPGAANFTVVLEVLARLFDELGASFAEQRIAMAPSTPAPGALAIGQWLALVDYSLVGLQLALPPPLQDSLLVTDLVRGRHGAVRTTLLLGMTAQDWPRGRPAQGIFAPQERAALLDAWQNSAQHDDLAPPLHGTDFDQSAGNAYLAEVALTRASELRYACRPLNGPGGEALAAAPEFRTLQAQSTTPALQVGQADWLGLNYARSESDLQLAAALPGMDALPGVDAYPAQAWATRMRGAANRWETLPRLAAALGFGSAPEQILRVSPSQLETMAACPFKHFARYGLALDARSENEFGRQQVGTIYHLLLEAVSRRLMQRSAAGAPTPETVREIFAEVLEGLGPQLTQLLGRKRAEYVRTRALLLLGDRQDWLSPQGVLEAGSPLPRIAQVEASFGYGGKLAPLRLPLASGELEVRGKIDRLDVDSAGRAWVVDYKLAGGRFSWPQFAAGSSLQLPLYLRALAPDVQGERFQPQAAYIQPLEPARKAGQYAAAPRQIPAPAGQLKREVRDQLEGGSLRDWTLAAAAQIAVQLAEWIVEGQISPQPLRQGEWTACAACGFRSVCRFDPQSGQTYRDVPPLDMQAVQSALAASESPELPSPPAPLPARKPRPGGAS